MAYGSIFVQIFLVGSGLRKTCLISAKVTFWPFKVIRGTDENTFVNVELQRQGSLQYGVTVSIGVVQFVILTFTKKTSYRKYLWTLVIPKSYKKLSYRRETARQLPTWKEGGARPPSPLPLCPLWLHPCVWLNP